MAFTVSAAPSATALLVIALASAATISLNGVPSTAKAGTDDALTVFSPRAQSCARPRPCRPRHRRTCRHKTPAVARFFRHNLQSSAGAGADGAFVAGPLTRDAGVDRADGFQGFPVRADIAAFQVFICVIQNLLMTRTGGGLLRYGNILFYSEGDERVGLDYLAGVMPNFRQRLILKDRFAGRAFRGRLGRFCRGRKAKRRS